MPIRSILTPFCTVLLRVSWLGGNGTSSVPILLSLLSFWKSKSDLSHFQLYSPKSDMYTVEPWLHTEASRGHNFSLWLTVGFYKWKWVIFCHCEHSKAHNALQQKVNCTFNHSVKELVGSSSAQGAVRGGQGIAHKYLIGSFTGLWVWMTFCLQAQCSNHYATDCPTLIVNIRARMLNAAFACVNAGFCRYHCNSFFVKLAQEEKDSIKPTHLERFHKLLWKSSYTINQFLFSR